MQDRRRPQHFVSQPEVQQQPRCVPEPQPQALVSAGPTSQEQLGTAALSVAVEPNPSLDPSDSLILAHSPAEPKPQPQPPDVASLHAVRPHAPAALAQLTFQHPSDGQQTACGGQQAFEPGSLRSTVHNLPQVVASPDTATGTARDGVLCTLLPKDAATHQPSTADRPPATMPLPVCTSRQAHRESAEQARAAHDATMVLRQQSFLSGKENAPTRSLGHGLRQEAAADHTPEHQEQRNLWPPTSSQSGELRQRRNHHWPQTPKVPAQEDCTPRALGVARELQTPLQPGVDSQAAQHPASRLVSLRPVAIANGTVRMDKAPLYHPPLDALHAAVARQTRACANTPSVSAEQQLVRDNLIEANDAQLRELRRAIVWLTQKKCAMLLGVWRSLSDVLYREGRWVKGCTPMKLGSLSLWMSGLCFEMCP